MEGFTLIKQGAEARIYSGTYLGRPCIAKERFVKKYRHPDLDEHLTKERMKAECRTIVRCRTFGVVTPTLYHVDFGRRTIFMEHLEHSTTAKEYIKSGDEERVRRLAEEVGATIALMHRNGVVHGDLTTSNILLLNDDETNNEKPRVAFVDFGLARQEASAEDKGVDLYVLERALLSTHSDAGDIFGDVMRSYRATYKKCEGVIAKFEDVRARGRKRTMVG